MGIFSIIRTFFENISNKTYQKVKSVYEKLSDELFVKVAYFNSCEELLSVNDCESNSLVLFDDCVNSQQQQTIKYYFVRGLHKNISCNYLTQSYAKVDTQLIRNNINFLCVFKQSSKHTKDIYDEHVGSDFTFEKFKEICNSCWSED